MAKTLRVPVAREVRFEIVADQRVYLRKVVQVVTGPGQVAKVDVSIDLSLDEWDQLRRNIKKARSKKRERIVRKLTRIERHGLGISPTAG